MELYCRDQAICQWQSEKLSRATNGNESTALVDFRGCVEEAPSRDGNIGYRSIWLVNNMVKV